MQEQIIEMTQTEYDNYTLCITCGGFMLGFIVALMVSAFITRNRE